MTMTFDEARDKLHAATRAIRAAEGDYRDAIDAAADAEAVYRYQVGVSYRAHREAGEAATASETLARADCVTYSRERDVLAGRVKLAADTLENRRDDRRTLWRLVEWSAKQTPPENTPSGDGYAQPTTGALYS